MEIIGISKKSFFLKFQCIEYIISKTKFLLQTSWKNHITALCYTNSKFELLWTLDNIYSKVAFNGKNYKNKTRYPLCKLYQPSLCSTNQNPLCIQRPGDKQTITEASFILPEQNSQKHNWCIWQSYLRQMKSRNGSDLW